MSDDTEFTEDELAAMRQGSRDMIGSHAHGGKMYYSMPPVRGMAPPGAFKIPRDVIERLGEGSAHDGGYIAHAMFGIEDDPDDPTIIHPDAVRIIGHGDLAKGHRVLKRFVQMLRRHGAQSRIEQPDGHSPDPRSIIRFSGMSFSSGSATPTSSTMWRLLDRYVRRRVSRHSACSQR